MRLDSSQTSYVRLVGTSVNFDHEILRIHYEFQLILSLIFSFKQFSINIHNFFLNSLEDRFLMGPNFIPCDGAYGFRLSNPPVLLVAGLKASLDLFEKVGSYYIYVCTNII